MKVTIKFLSFLHKGGNGLDGTVAFTRTFAFPGPEELNGSSLFLSDSLHPQFTPLYSLFLCSGDRDFTSHATNPSGFQLPIPDTPRCRDSRSLRSRGLRFSRVQSNSTSTSEARVADTRVSLPRPLASSQLMRPIAWLFNSRDPMSRDHVPPVPPKIDGFHGIWKSLLRYRRACNSCTRQPRYADMRWQPGSTCA
jgi:hypothetical protein